MTNELRLITDAGEIFRAYATHSATLEPRVSIPQAAADMIPRIIDRIAMGKPVRVSLMKLKFALEPVDVENPATTTVSEVISESLDMLHGNMIDQDVRAVSPTRASELLYNLPARFDLDVEYLMEARSEVPSLPAESPDDFEIVLGGLLLVSRLPLSKAAGATLQLSIPNPQEYFTGP